MDRSCIIEPLCHLVHLMALPELVDIQVSHGQIRAMHDSLAVGTELESYRSRGASLQITKF